jgi:DNA-binding CsgD family transcriptional regulator
MFNTTTTYRLDERIRELDEQLGDVPGNIFVKDRQGVILYSNKQMLRTMNLLSIDAVIGKTVHDFTSAEAADVISGYDQLALKKQIRCREYADLPNGDIAMFFSEKKPFYHNGKVIGTWGSSVAGPTFCQSTAVVEYVDSKAMRILKLTKRQKACLEQLVQGKSARETADTLNLSIRTVENHIYAIRAENDVSSLKSLLQRVRVIRSL